MDSTEHLASPKEYGESNGMSSRRRPPLHTCAVSFMAIGHRTYTKAQDLNGPIGTVAKRIAMSSSLASPLVSVARYIFLASVSFADDYILACEDVVGYLFPSSNHVFDKIEELVLITETLPGKFDVFMNKFPTENSLVPFLDWALVHVIAWLNLMVYKLAAWGSEDTREKDVMMDTNYNEHDREQFPIQPSTDHLPNKSKEGTVVVEPLITRGSYKNDGMDQPVSTKRSFEEESMIDLTVHSVFIKGSYKEEAMIQPVYGKGSDNEDEMVHPVSTSSEGSLLGFTVQSITTKCSYEEGAFQPDIKSYQKDSMGGFIVKPFITRRSDREECLIGSCKEDGLVDSLVQSNQCYKEENTVQPVSEKVFHSEDSTVGLTVQPVITNEPYEEDSIFEPVIETISCKDQDGMVSLTVTPVITKPSHEEDGRVNTVSEHGCSKEDIMAGLTVQPVIRQSVDENESHQEDKIVGLIVQPVTEKETHQEYGAVSENGLHNEDDVVGLTIQPVITNESDKEDGTVNLTVEPVFAKESCEGEGRDDLTIQPASAKPDSDEEQNRACYTVQSVSAKGTDEEKHTVGLTIQTSGSDERERRNNVGLRVEPVIRSYKEVLERGKKQDMPDKRYVARKIPNGNAKEWSEWGCAVTSTRRAGTRKQNGKKNRSSVSHRR